MSAIAREWFEERRPLLGLERTELEIYRAADQRQLGAWYTVGNFSEFARRLGDADPNIVADLMVDVQSQAWIRLEKYSDEARAYFPYSQWPDPTRFFFEGRDIRYKLTVPGRRRKEALEAKPVGQPNKVRA
jgi:hypothetical protein